MNLQQLHSFEWFNDPVDVSFQEQGMRIEAREKTDFWQSKHHRISKDNGHFLFKRISTDFIFTVCWRPNEKGLFNQCGAMLRVDDKNWFKISLMHDNPSRLKLGTSLTNRGYSDWASADINKDISEIWYRVKRVNGDYIASYSLDGVSFHQLRLFHLLEETDEVKVGAYICSPNQRDFSATLTNLDLV